MPKIDYQASIKVLAAVRGHAFDRNAFEGMFSGMTGISVTMVDQPAAAMLMNPEGMAPFDALLLYDMPGMDFAAPAPERPRPVDAPESLKAGFAALLANGKGVVAMHHALAAWPAWPDYASYLGGRFLYRPAPLRGRPCPDSGYAQDIDYLAEVVAPDHPVVSGLPSSFRVRDELYLAQIFEADVEPLLRARHPFTDGHFWSAAAAMEGRPSNREGWRHAPGSNLIGWTRRVSASRVVYLQPGDGPDAYDNPHIRRLVENAIRWVASPDGAEIVQN